VHSPTPARVLHIAHPPVASDSSLERSSTWSLFDRQLSQCRADRRGPRTARRCSRSWSFGRSPNVSLQRPVRCCRVGNQSALGPRAPLAYDLESAESCIDYALPAAFLDRPVSGPSCSRPDLATLVVLPTTRPEPIPLQCCAPKPRCVLRRSNHPLSTRGHSTSPICSRNRSSPCRRAVRWARFLARTTAPPPPRNGRPPKIGAERRPPSDNLEP